LSILFVPFYPLVMCLHLLGIGDVLDGALQWLFSLPVESREKLLPSWMMLGYVGVSIGAIFSRKVFYLLLFIAVLYLFYLFIPIE
ncbi:MAG: ComEC/Rec2 family competence protein, partial [Sulfurovum sp.]|nr:ComEC/Rec2 family competence protein [Sulfurovum sp.]